MANEKARHAFGNSSNIEAAKAANKIDRFDILFLDGDTKPKVGWLDSKGDVKIVDTEKVITVEGASLPEVGEEGKIYIFNNEGYFWNGTQFVSFSKSADLTTLEGQVNDLATQMDAKADVATVQDMIKEYSDSAIEVVEF